MANTEKTGNEKLAEMDSYKIKKATIIIRALNNKLRKQIITTIQARKKITVTNLYLELSLQQSILSQNLAILRRIGIVTQQREGKFIYYSINDDRMNQINELVAKLTA